MHQKKFLIALIVAAGFIASALPARAALIAEDFAYTVGELQGQNGGSGFTAAWTTATIRVYTRADSLAYTGGGYAITQTAGSGQGGVDFNNVRGLTRETTPLDGEVWFSFLMRNNSGSTDISSFGAVQFDPSTANGSLSTNYIQLIDGSINVNYAGSLTTGVATGLARNTTHLVVGRWVIGVGNDALDVWINPADLQNLGGANFSASSADALGDTFSRLGLMGLGTGTVLRVATDAIRISDGNGVGGTAFFEVTGVLIPEPASNALLAAGSVLLVGRRRATR